MAKAKKTTAKLPLPIRVARTHVKLIVAIFAGLVVGLMPVDLRIDGLARLLAGWDAGVLVYLFLAARFMSRCDAAAIKRRAAEEDEGGVIILLLSIVATFASLVAIVFALVGAKHGDGAPVTVALTIATIILSWAFVHTIFTFHYAHEYYGEKRDGALGGLDFPGEKSPDYRDFLYFALVIGMTSQVSDVQITSKVIRRMATMHSVLSFFFNLVVLALTVNVIASLV